ncbi:MAG: hypothetical protein ACJA01_000944 [Saprospiraceae bacterium]|jgi:hypothetical protein
MFLWSVALDYLKAINMQRYLFLGVLLLLGLGLKGQFGLRINYVKSSAPNWEQFLEENSYFNPSLFGSSVSLGLDYWFRLPQKRVEFYPSISYSKNSSHVNNSRLITELGDFEMKRIALNLNTHFYILDFKGDCDCPTFSKKGNFVKKGLFLSIHPGLAMHQKGFSLLSNQSEKSLIPNIGIGAGIDIGISDLFTITPIVQYNLSFEDTWENLSEATMDGEPTILETSNYNQLQLGIRIGFRPDYK